MDKQNDEIKQYELFWISRYRNEIYGVAALWITFYHAWLCKCSWPFPFGGLNLGIAGVEVFLFLSGISLYFSYSKKQSLVRFYKKRMIRIYIASLITLPQYILTNPAITRFPGEPVVRLIARFTGAGFWAGMYSFFWYIPMILACYFIYPALYRFIFSKEKTKDQVIRTGILCLIEILCYVVIKRYFHDYYSCIKPGLGRFPIFTIGCLAGRFVYQHDKMKRHFVFFSIPAVFLSSWILLKYYPDPGYDPPKLILYAILAVSLTVILSELFFVTEGTEWVFLNRFFRFLGSMSLEMYLCNILMFRLYLKGFPIPYQEGKILPYCIVMTAGIAMAYVWHRINSRILSAVNKRV